MGRIIFKILVVLCACAWAGQAQGKSYVFPIEDFKKAEDICRDEHVVYFKDVNKLLSPLLGHWVGFYQGKRYELWARLVERIKEPAGAYLDGLDADIEITKDEGTAVVFSSLDYTLSSWDPSKPIPFYFYGGAYTMIHAGDVDEQFGFIRLRAMPSGELSLSFQVDTFLGGDLSVPQLFPIHSRDSMILRRVGTEARLGETLLGFTPALDSYRTPATQVIRTVRRRVDDKTLFDLSDPSFLQTVVLAQGSMEFFTGSAYDYKPAGPYGLFRRGAPGARYPDRTEIRFDIRQPLAQGRLLPTLAQGLCHALITDRLTAMGRQDASIAKHLKETGYLQDDFARLFDYYAQAIGKTPQELALQYMTEMLRIAYADTDIDEEDFRSVLWEGLRGSQAWSHRESIDRQLLPPTLPSPLPPKP